MVNSYTLITGYILNKSVKITLYVATSSQIHEIQHELENEYNDNQSLMAQTQDLAQLKTIIIN